MSISSLGPNISATAQAMHGQINAPQPQSPQAGQGFSERISGAMRDLAETQGAASQAARDFESGARDDLAAVMVEQQLSSLSFQMTLQVRNKALSAYRDIMNMPV